MNPIKIDNSNKLNFINRITIFFLLTVILEGAIRKWISNTYSLEIILFRDSIVIIGILYGFISSTYSKSGIPEKILIIWTILVLFWLILQIVFKDLNFFVGLVGIRNWILYLWFSILIYRGFDRNQLNYLIKILVLLSFPIILLGCFQYFSPINSFINKPLVEGSFIFQFVDGVVRPSSFFTFTYGYTQFLFLVIQILFYFILFLQEKTNEKILPIILFFLILSSVFFSGSRQVIIFSGILLFFLIIKNKETKLISLRFVFLTFFIIFIILLFSDEIIFENIKNIKERFFYASSSESVSDRILYNIIGDPNTWKLFSLLGEGLGSSSNMSRGFINIYENEYFNYGHNEIDRIFLEGGLLGIIFIFLKYLFILYFLKKIFNQNFKKDNLIRYCLFYFIIIQFLFSSITGQITSQAITSIGLGMFLITIKTKEIK